ncbi:MAG: putative toxin-antitoxin system toxin component, PIN family [Candidatus Binatia bacterium]
MLVSAYAFGGVPAQALKAVLRTGDLFVSPELLAEYRDVPAHLRSSAKVSAYQHQALVSGIAAFVAEARLVVPTKPVAICRDPADDMVLACCRAARATVLLTGDRDLLALAEKLPSLAGFRRLTVLTPRAFIELALHHSATKR